jgi:hypothetical protein
MRSSPTSPLFPATSVQLRPLLACICHYSTCMYAPDKSKLRLRVLDEEITYKNTRSRGRPIWQVLKTHSDGSTISILRMKQAWPAAASFVSELYTCPMHGTRQIELLGKHIRKSHDLLDATSHRRGEISFYFRLTPLASPIVRDIFFWLGIRTDIMVCAIM